MYYFANPRPEIQAIVPPTVKKVLDVGCGAGAFGASLKKKIGCEVWGIEPMETAALEARNALDKVFVGLFEEVEDQIHERFDLVCFNDVLEHMPDPWNCLKRTRHLLNEKGAVIASLPNILHYQEFFEILWKKDFKYADAGIMDRTHMRFFTKKSMIRMFEDCGYKIIDIKGLDPTPSKKMRLLSLLSFGYFDEMKFPQFAIKACMAR